MNSIDRAGPDPSTTRAGSVQRAAERLRAAQTEHRPCEPVRDLLGPEDIHAAYAVQEINTQARLSAGAKVVGRKIGLTSPAVQAQLGVDQPDFGVLLDQMRRSQAAAIPMSELLQPKIEAEIVFALRRDLVDGPLDLAQVRDAVDYASAGLEIVDSRIENWDITITDTVADNASSGLFVMSDLAVDLSEFVPAEAQMTMHVHDEVVSSGSGAACLGDPLLALAWLARTARELGQPLTAGQLVLSGALGPMVAVTAGTTYVADISGLGQVGATFGPPSAQGAP